MNFVRNIGAIQGRPACAGVAAGANTDALTSLVLNVGTVGAVPSTVVTLTIAGTAVTLTSVTVERATGVATDITTSSALLDGTTGFTLTSQSTTTGTIVNTSPYKLCVMLPYEEVLFKGTRTLPLTATPNSGTPSAADNLPVCACVMLVHIIIIIMIIIP